MHHENPLLYTDRAHTYMTRSKPTILLILDGWGHSPENQGNAIASAHTPHWDALLKNHPHTLISGSGEDVGLPHGQMGNSEVGHLTIGSGRVIYQDLSRISHAIEQGDFFHNPILENTFKHAAASKQAVHIMGLLSPGGVHSHEDHLFACLQMAQDAQCPAIYVHAFLDGRDTPPQSAKASLEKLEQHLSTLPNAHLASLCGRYYAMDRDNRWERIKVAYDAIVYGQAPFYAPDALTALELAYARQETDEFVQPTCICEHPTKARHIAPQDSVIMMNFRSDRARELTTALMSPTFDAFDRGHYPVLSNLVTLTEYDASFTAWGVKVAFAPQTHRNVLAEYLQNHHLKQLHLAETEKYAHVTFFFNGGIEKPFEGEERILIPSPKVATYDLQPEMCAPQVTEKLVAAILGQEFDFIVCNYANADMVGHTGNFSATLKAIETLDQCLGEILRAVEQVGADLLITSDHGNAECMLDLIHDQPHTAHTTALVPLVYFGKQKIQFISHTGTLSDIAPTLLKLMGLMQPVEMTGQALIQVLS